MNVNLNVCGVLLQELVFPGAEPRWSLAELIHAVILMAHAHSLCSFVWGCGLNPEPDHTGGYTFQPPSPGHLPHSPAHEDGRQEVRRLSSQPVNSSFTCHTLLGRLADASRDFVLKQPCAVCSRWLMGPWRWRS